MSEQQHKIFKNLKQYFIPQLIETFQSEFSDEVKVFKYRGNFFIKAGTIHQSGGWARSLFKRMSLKFKIQNLKLRNILLLGLAGGTFVDILTKMYPNIHITAVDIDKKMVDIGRKYFHLNEYKNLKIKIVDAFQFIQKNTNKYDLIVIDIFQGDETPKEFSNKNFIVSAIKATNENGHVVINRLYFSKFKSQTDEYHNNLKKWGKELGFKIVNYFQNIGNKVLFLEKA